MAKNSMRRAFLIALITGILTIILTVPSILGAAESASNDTTIVGATSDPPSFWSTDPLELMAVEKIVVSAPTQVQVYLVTAKNYNDYAPDMAALSNARLNRGPGEDTVNDELTINVPQGQYVKYYVVVNDMDSPGVSVTISIEHKISHTFTGVVSLFMIAFVVSNIAWFAYLIPIERKYSAGSIYK